MDIPSKLTELGFMDVTMLGQDSRGTTVRIMTSNGWTYERFKTEDDAVRWAAQHKPPEVQE